MASPFSKPVEYAPYVDQVDKDLLVKAVTYKQGKFDLNRSKLQSQLNAAAQIPLDKEEDRQYFNERMTALVNTINLHGAGDISSDTRADYISGYIAEAADQNVANGYASTMYKRNYDAEWAELSKDDPDKFNQDNYNYGLLNYQKWLNDGQVGSNVNDYYNPRTGRGVGRVNPFVNVDEVIRENLKDIDPRISFQLTPLGNGIQYFNEKKEVITDQQVLNDINLTLSGDSRLRTQLDINTWSTYGNMPSEQLAVSLQSKYNNQISNIDKNIFALEQSMSGATLEQKEVITSNLEALNSNKKQIQQMASPEAIAQTLSDPKSRINAEFNLYTEDLFGGYIERYAKDEIVSRTNFTDEKAKADYNSNLRKSEAAYKASLDAANELSNRQFSLYKDIASAVGRGESELAQQLSTLFELPGMSTGLVGPDGKELTGQDILDMQTLSATTQIDQPSDGTNILPGVQYYKNLREAVDVTTESIKQIAAIDSKYGYTEEMLGKWTSEQFINEANNLELPEATRQRLLQAGTAKQSVESNIDPMLTVNEDLAVDLAIKLDETGKLSLEDAGMFDLAGKKLAYDTDENVGWWTDALTGASFTSENYNFYQLAKELDRKEDIEEGFDFLGLGIPGLQFDNKFTRAIDALGNDMYYLLGEIGGAIDGFTFGRFERLIQEGNFGYRNTFVTDENKRTLANPKTRERLFEYIRQKPGTVEVDGKTLKYSELPEKMGLIELGEKLEGMDPKLLTNYHNLNVTTRIDGAEDARELIENTLNLNMISIPGATYGINAEGQVETDPDKIVEYRDTYIDLDGAFAKEYKNRLDAYAEQLGYQEPQYKMIDLNTPAQSVYLDDALAAIRTLPDVDGEDLATSLPAYAQSSAALRKFMLSTNEDKESVNYFIKNLGKRPGEQVLSLSVDGELVDEYNIPYLPGTQLSRVIDEAYQAEVSRQNINFRNTTKFDRARIRGMNGGKPLYSELQPAASAFDPETNLIVQPQMSMVYYADPNMRGTEGYPGYKMLNLDSVKFYDANTQTLLGTINSLNGEAFGDVMNSFKNPEIYKERDNVLSANAQQVLLTESTKAFIDEFKKQQGE